MFNKEELGKNIKLALQRKNMRQIDLARACNTSGTNISNYLRGTYLPPLDVLVEMANALEISLDELCGIKPAHEEEKEETLGDASRMIEKLCRYGFCDIEEVTIARAYKSDGELHQYGEKCTVIMAYNGKLDKFIDGLSKMNNLLEEKTIDEEIYQSWLDGQLRKLDETLIKTSKATKSVKK